MNRKSKVIVSIVGITIVLLALLGITYAYYLTRIEGNTNTNSISVTTAELKLVYSDGNGLVTKENIMPGTTIEKTFTVKNEGNSKVDNYAVYLEEVINTLSRTEDLTYVLECESTSGSCAGTNGEFPTLSGLIVTNSIDVGVTHTYKLTVTYANLDTVDQSEDMGSSISAFVQIYAMKDIIDITGDVTGASEGDYIQINSVQKRSRIVGGKYTLGGVKPGSHTIKLCEKSDTTCSSPKLSKSITINLGTLANVNGDIITITEDSEKVTININLTDNTKTQINSNILEYNPYDVNTVAFKIVSNGAVIKKNDSTLVNKKLNRVVPTLTEDADNDDLSTVGLFQTEENSGVSVYYRGNVVNNYINYAGMCWRIVRINHDGDIKLILADRNNVCDNENYSISNGTSSYIDNNSY